MSNPVRIALIGAGLVGARHARHVAANPAMQLAWIAEPNEAAKELADEIGASWAPSLDEIPASDCDAAIVATPNADHLPTGLNCVARRWPCLIEKPIADSIADGQALIDAFANAKLPLLIGHHRRYHPFVKTARDLIHSGEIGLPVFVSAIWAVRKPESYFAKGAWRKTGSGGPLLINFIHEADLLLSLFGPVDEVQAMTSNTTRNASVEDTAVIGIRLTSGVLASIALTDAALSPWSFEGASGENPTIAETGIASWRIGCTAGSFDFPQMRIFKDAAGEQGDWSRPLAATLKEQEPITPLDAQLHHFADLIHGNVSVPEVSGEDGLNALRLVEAVFEAASHNKVQTRKEMP